MAEWSTTPVDVRSADTVSRVVSVEPIPLRSRRVDGGGDDLDAAQEAFLVVVTDDQGRRGIGEADGPPTVLAELLTMVDSHAWSRGLGEMVIGVDPLCSTAFYDAAYEATIWHGRRGLGVNLLSALDIALHDLAARQLGRPVADLLGGRRQDAALPYATVWPGPIQGRSVAEVMDDTLQRISAVLAQGFRAIKVELLFGDLATDLDLAVCLRDARSAVPPNVTMLLDVAYRWHDWRDAARFLEAVNDVDLWLIEAALQHDDLAGHAQLASRSRTRIGGAEMAVSRHECREWLERGRVDVLQPDLNRCGGFTEMRRIVTLAESYGAQVVPHGWATAITAAASRHAQVALPRIPLIEMLPAGQSDSELRRGLVTPEPRLVEGRIPVDDSPGLGVELDDDVVERFRIDRTFD